MDAAASSIPVTTDAATDATMKEGDEEVNDLPRLPPPATSGQAVVSEARLEKTDATTSTGAAVDITSPGLSQASNESQSKEDAQGVKDSRMEALANRSSSAQPLYNTASTIPTANPTPVVEEATSKVVGKKTSNSSEFLPPLVATSSATIAVKEPCEHTGSTKLETDSAARNESNGTPAREEKPSEVQKETSLTKEEFPAVPPEPVEPPSSASPTTSARPMEADPVEPPGAPPPTENATPTPVPQVVSTDSGLWTTDNVKIGTEVPIHLVQPYRYDAKPTSVPPTAQWFAAPNGREPSIWRSYVSALVVESTEQDEEVVHALDIVRDDWLASSETMLPPSALSLQLPNVTAQALLHIVRRDFLPVLIRLTVLEIVQASLLPRLATGQPVSIPAQPEPLYSVAEYSFAPGQIVTRIMAGCVQAYRLATGGNHRTSTRRRTVGDDPTVQLPVQRGGTVALYLLQNVFYRDGTTPVWVDKDNEPEDGNVDDEQLPWRNNPYLSLTMTDVGEWLGRKTGQYLTVSDLQDFLQPDVDLCCESPVDEEWPWWKYVVPAHGWDGAVMGLKCTSSNQATNDEDFSLSRTQWSLAVRWGDSSVEERRNRKSDKVAMFAKWRQTGLAQGYTHWTSWIDSAQDKLPKNSPAPTAAAIVTAEIPAELLAEAQQQTRRSRRAADTGQVFYGNQSNLTPKQVMDAILRCVSADRFQTTARLQATIPDESTDPLRRIRNALGKLVWKRRQLCTLPPSVPEHSNDSNGTLSSKISGLSDYMRYLTKTEEELRHLVMQQLTEVPVAIVATAADEREGSMESVDATMLRDDNVWSSDHPLVGRDVFRPAHEFHVDGMNECYWYTVQSFVDSVQASEPDNGGVMERSDIGNAREPTAVERRRRFRVVDSEGGRLTLTEAQVYAGIAAGELETKRSEGQGEVVINPFAGTGSKAVHVTLSSLDPRVPSIGGHVLGHDVVTENGKTSARILVLDERTETGKWARLSYNVDGALECTIDGSMDGAMYSIQQLDYHSSSPAFKACQTVVNFLERHAKAGPFLEPVDSVALNIPTYYTIVKNPMDIATLAKNLENGKYSAIPPRQAKGKSSVSRMLNGPFRRDVELIFDNAKLFNPPDDWIHQAAVSLKSAVIRKIDQLSTEGEDRTYARSRPRYNSMYVDDDSDVDIYEYESDQDEEFEVGGRSNSRRRGKRSGSSRKVPVKEDASTRAIERPLRLQKLLSEQSGLRGVLAGLPIDRDTALFAIPPGWECRRKQDRTSQVGQMSAETKIEELVTLYRTATPEQDLGGRRSTRGQTVPSSSQSQNTEISTRVCVEFVSAVVDASAPGSIKNLPRNTRHQVEVVCEQLHEEHFAKLYYETRKSSQQEQGIGEFDQGSFPPYLGQVVGSRWEIRDPIKALRWVLKGLIKSQHLTSLNEEDDVLILNNIYYIDPSIEPFEVLNMRELTRKKRAAVEEAAQEEDEVELSEYEQRRAERVARNAERLKALGLG